MDQVILELMPSWMVRVLLTLHSLLPNVQMVSLPITFKTEIRTCSILATELL